MTDKQNKKTKRKFNAVILADIFLLVASFPSVILPIFGFIGAAVQLRYKDEYATCMASKTDPSNILFLILRWKQVLFFFYSFVYFFFIFRPSNAWYKRLAYFFIFYNVLVLAVGVYGFVAKGNSPCTATTYNSVATMLCGIGAVMSLLTLIAAGGFTIKFNSDGKLPFFSSSKVKPTNERENMNDSNIGLTEAVDHVKEMS